jgi:hypothetical protein
VSLDEAIAIASKPFYQEAFGLPWPLRTRTLRSSSSGNTAINLLKIPAARELV